IYAQYHHVIFIAVLPRGAEIDLLIKMLSSEVWAVEVKHGLSPNPGRHYSNICDDVGADKKYVVYNRAGRHNGNIPFQDDAAATSISVIVCFIESIRS
ncbi:MAG: hypothetical protein ACNYPG_02890, partial [Candidatus Porifericomitaceae bacterium WSBS_2022_MAG_OTU9]